MKLVSAQEMRELDRRTIEEVGVPSLVLMENAGRSTYQVLRREFPDLKGSVGVVAGRGNNGGDGFVVARYLANDGFSVAVFLLAEKGQVHGDARVNLEILDRMGVPVTEVLTDADLNPVVHQLSRMELIVDALLGTGLNSPVKGIMAGLIDRVNHLRPRIVAVDIPSGLSADSGEPLGTAVKADVTVTYGFAKLGQILPPGRDYVGRLWVVDISIPAVFAAGLNVELAEPEEMRRCLPPRAFGSHKGSYGHLVVVAGSEGKTGACALTAEGALRAGAGLVTAACPASLNDILEAKITEAMTLPVPEAPGVRAFGSEALEPLLEFMAGKTALALGPGIGTHPETGELVRELVRRLPQPMVIDADGINCLSQEPGCLPDAVGSRILTPHPGEMARFLKLTVQEVQDRRLESARETAARYGVYLVLKGAQTVVAAPDGRVSLNSTGNPALASGGTGDVLTGLIGGFLAQHLVPWDAARLGVFLHGLAADYLMQTTGGRSLVAGDLLRVFPELLGKFLNEQVPQIEEGICFRRVMS